MKAIQTRFLPATNSLGSRIVADDGDGNRATIGYPHEAGMGEDAHRLAAIALCHKMNWDGSLVAGALKDSYVFVFVSDYSTKVIPPKPEGKQA